MGILNRQVTALCRIEQGFIPLHGTPAGSTVPLRWVEELNVHREAGKSPLLSQKGIYRVSVTKNVSPAELLKEFGTCFPEHILSGTVCH